MLQDAINRGDIDALMAIYEGDATLLVPPGGRSAHGHDEIRALMAPVLAARPHMASTVAKTLVGDGWRSLTPGGKLPATEGATPRSPAAALWCPGVGPTVRGASFSTTR